MWQAFFETIPGENRFEDTLPYDPPRKQVTHWDIVIHHFTEIFARLSKYLAM